MKIHFELPPMKKKRSW